MTGITNQRETTVCWSRTTGKPLCNCIVWDDARTSGVVRTFDRKLDEEGIDIDDEGEDAEEAKSDGVVMGSGSADAAFSHKGQVEGEGLIANVGKAMESLGLAGRGKAVGKRKRKGKKGLVDL